MEVSGFKPPDDKWEQMKSVWDACVAARIEIPAQVEAFFGGQRPDLNGVEVDSTELFKVGAIADWSDEGMAEGVEIFVEMIPDDVKVIRVCNAY